MEQDAIIQYVTGTFVGVEAVGAGAKTAMRKAWVASAP